jgi:iron only hydrogenase large subunit-like protein
MEAALRSAYFLVTGENCDPDAFKEVRGQNDWREYEFELAGSTLKIAVAHTLAATDKLLDALKRGDVEYHFVEVMACPGGCIAGAGTLLPVDLAAKVVGRYQTEARTESPLESPYRDAGENLD